MPAPAPSSRSREDLLTAVRASPEAVARHDKQGWLSLFSEQAVVEDPVGTAGSRGRAELGRFYETFIAPNDVSFEVAQDIVVGDTVLRDVVIEIRSAFGLVIRVPAYLLYELVEDDSCLKIARLAAHWELGRMAPLAMRQGVAGLKMMLSQSIRMVRIQGWAGVSGYMRGFRGIGARGKTALHGLAAAACVRDRTALQNLFGPRHDGVEFPAGGGQLNAERFLAALEGDLAVTDPLSAGFSTTFRFRAPAAGASHRGIGLLEFDPASRKIRRARFFWDD